MGAQALSLAWTDVIVTTEQIEAGLISTSKRTAKRCLQTEQ